jgi:type II secretory pathway component PulM
LGVQRMDKEQNQRMWTQVFLVMCILLALFWLNEANRTYKKLGTLKAVDASVDEAQPEEENTDA